MAGNGERLQRVDSSCRAAPWHTRQSVRLVCGEPPARQVRLCPLDSILRQLRRTDCGEWSPSRWPSESQWRNTRTSLTLSFGQAFYGIREHRGFWNICEPTRRLDGMRRLLTTGTADVVIGAITKRIGTGANSNSWLSLVLTGPSVPPTPVGSRPSGC